MATLGEVVSNLKNGVINIGQLSKILSFFMGGAVTAVNNVTTTGAQVLAANSARINLSFHNPGNVNLFVYPLVNALGTTNAPTLSALGGSFVVFPGAYFAVVDTTNGAWGAFAASGTTNPLTILER